MMPCLRLCHLCVNHFLACACQVSTMVVRRWSMHRGWAQVTWQVICDLLAHDVGVCSTLDPVVVAPLPRF